MPNIFFIPFFYTLYKLLNYYIYIKNILIKIYIYICTQAWEIQWWHCFILFRTWHSSSIHINCNWRLIINKFYIIVLLIIWFPPGNLATFVCMYSAWLCFFCFYAKAAKMRVAAEGLEDGRVTKRSAGGITKTRSARRTGTELFAVTRKARKSTRIFVVCTYHLLRPLLRSSFSRRYF